MTAGLAEALNIISGNLKDIKKKIEIASQKVKRNPDEVKILPITKNIKISIIKQLKEFGFTEIGENRIAEIEEKYPFLKDDFSIHLVGKLQKNKVKIAVNLINVIHSLDDIEVAKLLEEELSKKEKKIEGLIEVNIANEKSKNGISVEEITDFLHETRKFKYLKITGLMTMPPITNNPENSIKYFQQLRILLEKFSKDYPDLKKLSMGTSQDFEVAVENGANILRLGTVIFKGI